MNEESNSRSIRYKEVEFLLSCLVEAQTRQSRQIVLERLIPALPIGHHPIKFIENHSDPMIRHQLRINHAVYLNEIKLRVDIKRHIRLSRDPDLEMGAFLISRLSGDVDWTPESFKISLDSFIKPFFRNLQNDWNPVEKLNHFIEFVFQEQLLGPDKKNYYNPENSYLTHVLKSRKGIPVSLGVICILLAKRTGLKLDGINMPGHFLLRYFNGSGSKIFIDPYNSGYQLSEEECLLFLEKQHIKPSADYLEPADTVSIMKRMYRNLISFYSTSGESRKEKILRQHFAILENGSI